MNDNEHSNNIIRYLEPQLIHNFGNVIIEVGATGYEMSGNTLQLFKARLISKIARVIVDNEFYKKIVYHNSSGDIEHFVKFTFADKKFFTQIIPFYSKGEMKTVNVNVDTMFPFEILFVDVLTRHLDTHIFFTKLKADDEFVYKARILVETGDEL